LKKKCHIIVTLGSSLFSTHVSIPSPNYLNLVLKVEKRIRLFEVCLIFPHGILIQKLIELTIVEHIAHCLTVRVDEIFIKRERQVLFMWNSMIPLEERYMENMM